MTEQTFKIWLTLMAVLIAIGFIIVTSGCTISMQNISTHGTATDLIDEDQTATPDIKTDLSLPIKPL